MRRPFAPGAVGFRAMSKVSLNGQPYAGAQVAAFLNAQSVVQRLNAVVPGRWRQQFRAASRPSWSPGRQPQALPGLPADRHAAARARRPPVDAVYEDVGEMDAGSLAGLKALYSDARKRAGVAAGIGAYLYTALAPVVLPIGPNPRQVQAIRRQGKGDLLVLSPETEQWLRRGYRDAHAHRRRRAATSARCSPTANPTPRWARARPPTHAAPAQRAAHRDTDHRRRNGHGDVVAVDFGALGPTRTRGGVVSAARGRLAAQAAAAGYSSASWR